MCSVAQEVRRSTARLRQRWEFEGQCWNDEKPTLLVGMESRLLTWGCILSRKEKESKRRGLMDWGRDGSKQRCPEKAKKHVCKSSGGRGCCRQRVVYLVFKILEVLQCAFLESWALSSSEAESEPRGFQLNQKWNWWK